MRILAVRDNTGRDCTDELAVEAPLAIAVVHRPPDRRVRTVISVTLRTPGEDAELAVGLLYAEGVIDDREQVLAVEPAHASETVRVELHPEVTVDLGRLERRGYTSAACGLCGKTSIAAVHALCEGPKPGGDPVPAATIHALPERLRARQRTFARTGGLHAAALFNYSGELLAVREDVGRHNAVDKLIGGEFLTGRLPLASRILVVSGRAGFELIQKAARAGVPVFAAVGAPSSLAVELAADLGVTLIGFLRDGRFNIYCGAERIDVEREIGE